MDKGCPEPPSPPSPPPPPPPPPSPPPTPCAPPGKWPDHPNCAVDTWRCCEDPALKCYLKNAGAIKTLRSSFSACVARHAPKRSTLMFPG